MPKKIQWWVLGSGVLMVLGAFSPWVYAVTGEGWFSTFYDGSIAGTGGSYGWLVVAAAAIAGGLFELRRASRDAGVWALLGGVAGLAVTGYGYGHLHDAIRHTFPGDRAEWAIGLPLALLASISMATAGVVVLRSRQSRWRSPGSAR